MLLVFVRILLNDTVSSRTMSGPSTSLATSRSTESPRSLSGSVLGRAEPCHQVTDAAQGVAVFDGCFQQRGLRHP